MAASSISWMVWSVVDWIVVNQGDVSYTGSICNFDHILVGTMTPVLFRRVFGRQVLGVVDDEVSASHELCVPPVACGGRMDSICPTGAPVRQSVSEKGSWSVR